jgi:hypothetical protein
MMHCAAVAVRMILIISFGALIPTRTFGENTPNPDLLNKTATVGAPWTPRLVMSGLPCTCPVNRSSDFCAFRVVGLPEPMTHLGRITGITRLGVKTISPVQPFVLQKQGSDQLNVTFNCPNGEKPDPLEPDKQLTYNHLFTFTIFVQSASPATSNNVPPACLGFLRESQEINGPVGRRQTLCMYQKCLNNGGLPASPEYSQCR